MNLITSIESFTFKLGGFFASLYEVSFEKNVVTYVTKSSPFDEGLKYEKEISSESIEIFQAKLNRLNFITWQDEYYNPVLDGEDWEIDITYNSSFRKKIFGLNGYPGENSNYIGRTEIFNELLLALNVLIQEPVFFQMNS